MKHKFLAALAIITAMTLFAVVPLSFAQSTEYITLKPTTTPRAQNKVALRLADLFDVPYDEIMGWHQQGFGFGSIRIAYTIQRNVTKDQAPDVASIFALRTGGMGWGEIAKYYDVSLKPIAGNPWGDGKPGNPDPPGLQKTPPGHGGNGHGGAGP